MTEPEDPSTAVAVAYVHEETVHYSWHHSMLQLLDYDAAHEARIWRGGYVEMRSATDGLAQARNNAVTQFLRDSTAQWLWWVDTDMGFPADAVDRLFDAADPADRPMVGALCFALRHADNDGMGGRRMVAAPMVLDWKTIDAESGFDPRWDYPRETVTRCHGTGSACVLIHRSVFERVRDAFGPNWYTRARNPSTGEMIGEDLSFCVRVNALSIPIYVHTGVPTTHAKWMWLSEEDYWRQRALDPPPHVQKRDWTVPRYAIIPTHNRPKLLLSLVASLGAQCDHIVVLDNASDPPVDEAALKDVAGEATVEVIHDPQQPPNLAHFWNCLFRRCASDVAIRGNDTWDVAVLNDDAAVPAGWYDACATALREHETAVIAHTGDSPIREPDLLTDFDFDRSRRMAPHAFVVRGEVGLEADESMKFWYFDDDFSREAIRHGGVLATPGPVVRNSLATQSTVGVLAEQVKQDRLTFIEKWGGTP